MTNEEAIKILKKARLAGIVDVGINYALDMAIKALEQEPCEDTISREAVLEKAIIVPIAKVVTEDKVICRKVVFVEDIQNLPSVTPKFTDDEVQKMQDLEQAQLDKAYELGRAEVQPSEDCISRTALLAKIDEERKHLLDLKMDGAEHIIVHHARRIIEDMPSVAGSEG